MPSKPCAFFDQLSSTRLFGFPATSLGDPIVTQGKTFFVFDIVNVFSVNELTEICIGCYLSTGSPSALFVGSAFRGHLVGIY